MKKALALVGVVGVALAGGQYFSATTAHKMMDKTAEDMAKQGFKTAETDTQKGFLKSHSKQVFSVVLDNQPVQIEMDYNLTHLPWGGSFNGDIEVIVPGEEAGQQKLFAELLKTTAKFDGGYNLANSTHSTIVIDAFDTEFKSEKLHVVMADPFEMGVSSNFKGTTFDFESELKKLEFLPTAEESERHKNNKIIIEGLKMSGNQDGVWPDNSSMESNVTLDLDSLLFLVDNGDKKIDLKDLEFDVDAGIDSGELTYHVEASLAKIDFKENEKAFTGEGKGKFSLTGLEIGSFKDLVKQSQEKFRTATQNGVDRDRAAMQALQEVYFSNKDAVLAASKDLFKDSDLRIALEGVDVKTSTDEMPHLKADAEVTLDTKSIDFDQLVKAAQVPSPFALMRYVKNISAKVKASGVPADIMSKARAEGDELDVTFKDGVLTVNGEARPVM